MRPKSDVQPVRRTYRKVDIHRKIGRWLVLVAWKILQWLWSAAS
jgi:hypothetical protein